ncbi:hypothetical protein DFH07DRAFT_766917 [Mycena maculata]|uniref:Uncharacterized protein n=1 Tax=Mycena maculata TaxID=230809 RepID=A0AAD7K114_9AGAR|nr:hypothetical protein DFH07DRAFT_766917 [Mycena maculata]
MKLSISVAALLSLAASGAVSSISAWTVSSKACSAEALASHALEKRQTGDSCIISEKKVICAAGTAPTASDCDALETAIITAFDQPGEFSLGTCLWSWVNNNPVGGATLEYCYSDLVDETCVDSGDLGVIEPLDPTLSPVFDWFLECVFCYM